MANLPEPDWGTDPQPIEFDPSSLCSTGMRPSYMTGVLLRLLEAHFADPDNIVDAALKGLIWAAHGDNSVTTRILIEPYHRYEAKNIQQRPAIYVRRGPFQAQSFAIRDRSLTHLRRRTGNLEGSDFYKMMTGQHQIICVAKGPGDMAAERISEEVFYTLLEYAPAIKQDMKLGRFNTTTLSPTSLVDEDQQNYAAGISCTWITAHSWTLKTIAPILRDVRFFRESSPVDN